MAYTVLAHTADTGIEATADSLAELVADLANGMFAAVGRPHSTGERHTVDLQVATASDPEDLVVDVLSELLYESEVRDMLFSEIVCEPTGDTEWLIHAVGVDNAHVDVSGPPVKAVTYHRLEVRHDSSGWYGRVYLDV